MCIRKLFGALVILTTVGNSLSALAELPGEFSANVAFTTNYHVRGITLSDKGPAIQGGFDYELDIFYAGVAGSSVNFGNNTTMELSSYVGIMPTIGMLTFDLGLSYYAYPGGPDADGETQDFMEGYGLVSVPLGPLVIGGGVYYSPDFYGGFGPATYYEAAVALDLSDEIGIEGLSINASYGLSRFDDTVLDYDYGDYSLGLNVPAFGFYLGLQYYETLEGSLDSSGTSFTISRSF